MHDRAIEDLMNRPGVTLLHRETHIGQPVDQPIALVLGHQGGPAIIDMLATDILDRRPQPGDAGKHVGQLESQLDAIMNDALGPVELYGGNGRRWFGHSKIETHRMMRVAELAVIDSITHVSVELIVVGNDKAALAALNMLMHVKTEHTQMTNGPGILVSLLGHG